MADILDKARRVLALAEKAATGPLIINRFDNDCGSFSYQLQQERNPGDVLCGFDEEDCKRARTSAEFVADAYSSAPDLAAFVVLVDSTLDVFSSPAAPVGWSSSEASAYEHGFMAAIEHVKRALGLPTTEER